MNAAPSAPSGAQQRFVLTRLLPFGFIAAGVFASWLGIGDLLMAIASASWPVTDAQVIASSVEYISPGGDGTGGRNPSYRAHVQYSFAVGGLSYSGNTLIYGHADFRDQGNAYAAIAPYRPELTVPVYYNPENPEENVLEPGVHTKTLVMPLFGLLCLIVGILIFKFLPGLIDKQKTARC